MTLTPVPASTVLDAYFLEARSKLLDLAAILDRLDRGGGIDDPRIDLIRQAVDVISDSEPGLAEQVQKVFSLPYDPNWKRPTPR